MKYLDLDELVDGGYLQEVNRRFFHPLGLALEATRFTAGTAKPMVIQIQDHRDDLEGVAFTETPSRDKFEKVYAEELRRRPIREKAVGFYIQPFSVSFDSAPTVVVDAAGDHVCKHGTAMDVHCCGCHSGFIFERDHVCEEESA